MFKVIRTGKRKSKYSYRLLSVFIFSKFMPLRSTNYQVELINPCHVYSKTMEEDGHKSYICWGKFYTKTS